MNPVPNPAGYWVMIKVTRIGYELLRRGELIEGDDIPTEVGIVEKVISTERIEDGKWLSTYWVSC